MEMTWQSSFEKVSQYMVKLSTPDCFGSGFVLASSETQKLLGIATAAHVIKDAHYWQKPIRIEHFKSGKTIFVPYADRAILLDEKNDTAVIIINYSDFINPAPSLNLAPLSKHLKIGVEVGWIGFPVVFPSQPCFFSGRVSSYSFGDKYYLIDGVAINGVSGGPAFNVANDVIGVVSAYLVNRSKGDALPGLSIVSNVIQFHDSITKLKSLDEAKNREEKTTPPVSPKTEECVKDNEKKKE